MVRINGLAFRAGEFHNGEVIFESVNKIDEQSNVIEMNFKNNKDITAVLFARQWLKDKAPLAKCKLVMKYCPYERMDREINDQLFSMRYFAEIISKFDFDTVTILDPHSQVCVEQLRINGFKVEILELSTYVKKVINEFKPDYLFYPDKGAATKYPQILDDIDIPYFFGAKCRDLANKGRIKDYELVDAPDLKNKKVLIIDDICCLGGTAYNAATLMKDKGVNEVAFYISHCENGVFAGNLLKIDKAGRYVVDRIYTANTMLLDDNHENITVIE